jgi:lipopolysaccharide export system protein LptC
MTTVRPGSGSGGGGRPTRGPRPVLRAAASPVVAPAAPRHHLPPSRERRTPRPEQLARRRVLVGLAKRLLPVLALALLAVVVFWPEIEGNDERSRVSFRRVAQPRAESLRVVSPRYQDLDEMSRPYTVTARVAQQVGGEQMLDLDAPRADMLLTDGGWVFVSADTGRYDRPQHHLDLAGDVTVYHDNGMTLRTPEAAVEVEEGTASGDAPVAAQGPFGTLEAEGFRLKDRGAVVIFTGRAHAVLEGGPE